MIATAFQFIRLVFVMRLVVACVPAGENAVIDVRHSVSAQFPSPSAQTLIAFRNTPSAQLDSSKYYTLMLPESAMKKAWEDFKVDGSWIVRSKTKEDQEVLFVMSRDMTAERSDKLGQVVNRGDSRTTKLVVRDTDGKLITSEGEIAVASAGEYLHDPARIRAAYFGGTLYIEHLPPPEDAKKARMEIVSPKVDALTGMLTKLSSEASNDVRLKGIGELEAGLNELFETLAKKNLQNDGLILYELCLANVITTARSTAGSPATIAMLNDYVSGVAASLEKKKCSVVVNASKGDGATISYAKQSVADVNGEFTMVDQPKTQSVPLSLERAVYTFRAFRNGKQTGHKDKVDCTRISDLAQIVQVDEDG